LRLQRFFNHVGYTDWFFSIFKLKTENFLKNLLIYLKYKW
jgi:hypothetical protein